MIAEFVGKHCHACGGSQYVEYTLFREGPVMGKVYKAQVVCRDCGRVVASASDPDERRAMELARHTQEN